MNRKQLVRKLQKTQKLSFMCLFCFGVFQITKNHFCDEAASIDGVVSPEMKKALKVDYKNKKKTGLL
tara:strand:+ start:54 stop:254 length:201 start_codon:yes stop_codon:yes gene_type:complete